MVQDKDFFSIWSARLQSVLRIVVAGLFLTHGTAKLLHVPHIPSFDNVELMSLVGIAGLLELVGGFLLLIGLFTRPVAVILSGEMAVAYFMAHGPRNLLPILNGGELAAIYCFVFLYSPRRVAVSGASTNGGAVHARTGYGGARASMSIGPRLRCRPVIANDFPGLHSTPTRTPSISHSAALAR